MIRKMLSLILVLSIFIVPLGVIADDSGTFKGINWSLDKKGNLVLEGGETVPTEGPWQTYRKDIKNIVIGDGISRIESNAFVELNNLKTVTLGKDVVTLERNAFLWCKKLKSVTLLSEKTILSGLSFFDSAFSELNLPENSNYTIIDNCVLTNDGMTLVYCLGGKNVVVPDSVEKIASGAFCSNKSIVSIVLPFSLKELGMCSFQNCANLKELTFCGDDLIIDGTEVFENCRKLKNIVLPAVSFIGLNPLEEQRYFTFWGCDSLETVVFVEGTKEIPGTTFRDCFKIKNVFVPESVTIINDTAFERQSKNLVIRCIEGSFAEQFAKENGYKYEYYNPVQSIVLSETELSLKVKKTASLKYTMEPADITVKDTMWISSNDRIAMVKKGKVQAIASGECDIICQAMDGSGIRAICHVVVE